MSAREDAVALLVRAIDLLVDENVRGRLEAMTADCDPWIPHREWPFPNPTRHAAQIADARKIDRVWVARRSAIDAFIESHPRRSTSTPANDAPSTPMARAVADLGFAPTRKAVRQ